MPFLQSKCPKCKKVAESKREFTIGDKIVLLLNCGHTISKDQLSHKDASSIVSLDGKKLYPFQVDGVKFIENSGGRALVADEMGLGKTVQSLGTLALHPEMLPAFYIVKASLKYQWQHEHMRWLGEDAMTQVIEGPKDFFIPGMDAYILSYDILRRFEDKKDNKSYLEKQSNGQWQEQARAPENRLITQIHKLGIKTIVLDECQQIKNLESQRTQFVRKLCKEVPNVIALSGTPIKNNAAEYFPVLNILKPEIYPRYSTFLQNECDSYFTGYGYKTGGLRDPERFLQKTKSFIIRRERKEVLPDLPPIRRDFSFHELSKEVEKAYIDEFKKFRDEYNSMGDEYSEFEEQSNILAYLSRMRHLTGLSKIDPCIDHVMDIMGSTEDRVCIFVHHQDVMEILEKKLNHLFNELNLPKAATHKAGDQSRETEEKFARARVLICSTLAGGEGLNLQKLCFRFIMLERQWNSSNEEQAEARFPRPEGIKTEAIEGTYFVALGTVDEFFAEIVERKREIVGKTLNGKAVEWDQTSMMKELASTLAANGGRRWSI